MKAHTKIYLNSVGYDITDFVPSELSGKRAIDIHHVVSRENRIENLMAVTREEHIKYGEIKSKMVYLLETHREFLINKGVRFSNKWFNEKIKEYENRD